MAKDDGTLTSRSTSKSLSNFDRETMNQIAAILLSCVLQQDNLSHLIEQLGTEDISKRDEAQRLLLRQIGSQRVREELEKLEKGGDAERAGRARFILGWVRPAASEAGIRLKAQVQVQESGAITLDIEVTNMGDEDCMVADPNYWDCWRFFTLEVLEEDGSVKKGAIKTTRAEGGFRGMAPAAVPLGKGVTRKYTEAVIEGLVPGTHVLRIKAKAMEGAKGYEGRSPRELPATKDAVAIVTVSLPAKK